MPDLPVWTELERSVAASMPLIGEVRSAAWAREAHAALQVAKIVLQKLVDEAPIREGERQA